MRIHEARKASPAGAYALVCGVLAVVAGMAPGCTLALDTRAAQCRTNQDCTKFAGSGCDQVLRICVPVSDMVPGSGGVTVQNDAGVDGGGGGGGAGGGTGGPLCRTPSGCVACTGGELPNACTDATCIPFDNRGRLMNLDADGGLKPLP